MRHITSIPSLDIDLRVRVRLNISKLLCYSANSVRCHDNVLKSKFMVVSRGSEDMGRGCFFWTVLGVLDINFYVECVVYDLGVTLYVWAGESLLAGFILRTIFTVSQWCSEEGYGQVQEF